MALTQPASTPARRIGIFLGLALAMALTRGHYRTEHFDALPDASWGVFFLAGFWLRHSARWAYPLLFAEAVLIDYVVITHSGISFWDHYCVSPGYWFLLPAYFSLWLGGSWLARHDRGLHWSMLGYAAAALLIGEGACYLLSNGSFYWLSARVPQPRSVEAWAANFGNWYWLFLEGTALYVGIGALLHVMATTLARMAERGLRH